MGTLEEVLTNEFITSLKEDASNWLFTEVNQDVEPTYILDIFYDNGLTNINGDNMWNNVIIRLHLSKPCEINLTLADAQDFITQTVMHSVFELAYRGSNWVFFSLDENQGKNVKDTNSLPITTADKVIFRTKDYDFNKIIEDNNNSYKQLINWVDNNIIHEITSICIKIG